MLTFDESIVPYNRTVLACCLSTIGGQSVHWVEVCCLVDKQRTIYADARIPNNMIYVIDTQTREILHTVLVGKGICLSKENYDLIKEKSVKYTSLQTRALAVFFDSIITRLPDRAIGSLEQHIVNLCPYMDTVFNQIKTSMSVAP